MGLDSYPIRLAVVHDLKHGFFVEVLNLEENRWMRVSDKQGYTRYWGTAESARRNALRYLTKGEASVT